MHLAADPDARMYVPPDCHGQAWPSLSVPLRNSRGASPDRRPSIGRRVFDRGTPGCQPTRALVLLFAVSLRTTLSFVAPSRPALSVLVAARRPVAVLLRSPNHVGYRCSSAWKRSSKVFAARHFGAVT